MNVSKLIMSVTAASFVLAGCSGGKEIASGTGSITPPSKPSNISGSSTPTIGGSQGVGATAVTAVSALAEQTTAAAAKTNENLEAINNKLDSLNDDMDQVKTTSLIGAVAAPLAVIGAAVAATFAAMGRSEGAEAHNSLASTLGTIDKTVTAVDDNGKATNLVLNAGFGTAQADREAKAKEVRAKITGDGDITREQLADSQAEEAQQREAQIRALEAQLAATEKRLRESNEALAQRMIDVSSAQFAEVKVDVEALAVKTKALEDMTQEDLQELANRIEGEATLLAKKTSELEAAANMANAEQKQQLQALAAKYKALSDALGQAQYEIAALELQQMKFVAGTELPPNVGGSEQSAASQQANIESNKGNAADFYIYGPDQQPILLPKLR